MVSCQSVRSNHSKCSLLMATMVMTLCFPFLSIGRCCRYYYYLYQSLCHLTNYYCFGVISTLAVSIWEIPSPIELRLYFRWLQIDSAKMVWLMWIQTAVNWLRLAMMNVDVDDLNRFSFVHWTLRSMKMLSLMLVVLVFLVATLIHAWHDFVLKIYLFRCSEFIDV